MAQCECSAFRFDKTIDEYVCIDCGAVAEDDYSEDDDDWGGVCPECGGDGMADDSTECEYCDGYGYKWWE